MPLQLTGVTDTCIYVGGQGMSTQEERVGVIGRQGGRKNKGIEVRIKE